MGDHMKIKKVTIFILLISTVFIFLNLRLESNASIDMERGITIVIGYDSNDGIDIEDIHVELMVLKSDFNEYQTYSSISEEYKAIYPNYESYTHLEDDNEMSYLAFVQGTIISESGNVIFYNNEFRAEDSITYLRLIMFKTDGTILATSQLFLHNDPNQDSYYSRSYEIDYANLEFFQLGPTETIGVFAALFFLLMIVAAAFLLVFMGALIWLIKTGLSSLLEIKYKKPIGTMIFDSLYIILGVFLIYFVYIRRLLSTWQIAVLWITLLFLVWNLINFFFLAQKDTRKKYWIILVVTLIISGLFAWLIISQSFLMII
jgi:hypothetical protein